MLVVLFSQSLNNSSVKIFINDEMAEARFQDWCSALGYVMFQSLEQYLPPQFVPSIFPVLAGLNGEPST